MAAQWKRSDGSGWMEAMVAMAARWKQRNVSGWMEAMVAMAVVVMAAARHYGIGSGSLRLQSQRLVTMAMTAVQHDGDDSGAARW